MTAINITDNSDAYKDEMKAAKDRILETWGLMGEGYAKRLCPVDTGRLRNSISHDRDGDSAYIGTNVEYAPYVELGTHRQKAQPFLKPAVADHTNEYKQTAEKILKGL